MRILVAIILLTGLILVLSIVPGHTHVVNWGVSVNLGLPVYAGPAPVYPVAYPTYVAPAPVYPVYPVVVAPRYHYHGGHYRPYHQHFYRYHRR